MTTPKAQPEAPTAVAGHSEPVRDGLGVSATPAPSAPAARPMPASLRSTTQDQCADTRFLSRFICSERVRLRFCRDRWNGHADCMLDPPKEP